MINQSIEDESFGKSSHIVNVISEKKAPNFGIRDIPNNPNTPEMSKDKSGTDAKNILQNISS
jgi:hypothetical protein